MKKQKKCVLFFLSLLNGKNYIKKAVTFPNSKTDKKKTRRISTMPLLPDDQNVSRMNKLKPLLLFFAMLCFLFSSCTADKESNAKQQIETVKQHLADNQFKTAVIELKNILATNPEDDQAHYLLGDAYLKLNNLTKAFQHYSRAVTINPENIDAQLKLGQLYLKNSDLISARSIVEKVMNALPENTNAFHLLAGIQIRERNIMAAISTMEKAVGIAPQDFKPNMFLSHLYGTAGKKDMAEAAYLKTISLDSSQRAPYYELSKLYIADRQWEKTEALLKRVVLTPGIKNQKHTDLARFYESQRKLELAEKNYLEAVAAAPQTVEPLLNLAEFYVRLNQKGKAIQEMEKALLLKKDTAGVLTGLAQIHFHFNDGAKAATYIEQALEQDRDHTGALYMKGRLLIQKHEFSSASDLFHKILQKDPYNAGAYYYEAICIKENKSLQLSGENVSQATGGLLDSPQLFKEKMIKDYLKTAASLDPEFQDSRIQLAQIYLAENDLDKAREQIEQILNLTPRGPDILTLLSELNLREGNFKSAEKFCRLMLKQMPEYGPAYIQLGLVHRAAGRPSEAKASFKTALNLYSGRKEVLEFIINLYMKDKKYADALEILDNINLSKEPGHQALVKYLEGTAAAARNENQIAMDHLKASIESDPSYTPASLSLAELYIRDNQAEKAMPLYTQVLAENPSHIPALMGLGYVHDLAGRQDQALELYRKVLMTRPDHVNAANNLAFILAKSADTLGEAYSLAAQAKEKNPENPNIIDTLGWIYYKRNSYTNAVREFKASLELSPENPVTCYHLGLTYHEMKEYELSRLYFQKALDLDPHFKGSDEARLLLN